MHGCGQWLWSVGVVSGCGQCWLLSLWLFYPSIWLVTTESMWPLSQDLPSCRHIRHSKPTLVGIIWVVRGGLSVWEERRKGGGGGRWMWWVRRGQGVRSEDQARSLAKFIFNETAAVQGTIIQPCSGIVTDSIQAIMQLLQGVVTYMSPVEAFATGIKNFDRWKWSLITWSLRSEADYTMKAL